MSDLSNLDQIKSAMRAQWMAGDFGVIARTIAEPADRFARELQLAPGTRVLDVACGTGNVAIPLARLGCVVNGVDIATNLLEQARLRAAGEELPITFDEGDAEQLPYPDASFGAVVSMFGAMFAPRPEIVVAELARVLAPGGLLAMANWSPASFSGAMFRVSARHVPPPSSLPAPVLWGDAAVVRERLGPWFEVVECETVPIDFDLATDAAGAVTLFRRYFGPTQVAFSRLDPERQTAFAADLEGLWAGANVATVPEKRMLVRNEYLRVSARRAA